MQGTSCTCLQNWQKICSAKHRQAKFHAICAGTSETTPEQVRTQLGRAIRQLKSHWRLGAVLVPLLQLPAAIPLGVEPRSVQPSPSGASPSSSGPDKQGDEQRQQLLQHVDTVQALLSAATGFGLEDCWQWKPLLDGKQVGSCSCWYA